MRSYVIAGLIGFMLGLAQIYVVSLVPFWSDWQIPFYDGDFFSTMPTENGADRLTNQALIFRFYHLLVDRGFPFFAIPVGFGLGIVKLTRLAAKSRVARVMRILLSLYFSSIAAAVGYLCFGQNLGSPSFDTAMFALSFAVLGNFSGTLTWLFRNTENGVVPTIALVAVFGWLAFDSLRERRNQPGSASEKAG